MDSHPMAFSFHPPSIPLSAQNSQHSAHSAQVVLHLIRFPDKALLRFPGLTLNLEYLLTVEE
jgi:hypothetical protein